MNSGDEFPADDLQHLQVAFNQLGRHKFGSAWPTDMVDSVRIGKRPPRGSDRQIMGQWALRALKQCVQNGWLPLVYFDGDRRVWYYSNPDGHSLHNLFPRPTEDECGQIQLANGEIHFCMVNLRDFASVLTSRYSKKASARPGRSREYKDFDEALDRLFLDHPTSLKPKEVKALLSSYFKGKEPGRTTVYTRIEEAQERAIVRHRPEIMPDSNSDG